MALLNKIFSKRKIPKASIESGSRSEFPTQFNSDKVRVLMFRECDWSGRRLLFDSSAVEKSSNFHQESFDLGYQDACKNKIPTKPSSDYKQFEEMAFGSVAVSFRANMLKIHWLDSPARLVCSQVFMAPKQTSNSSNNPSFSSASSSSRFSTSLVPELNDTNYECSFSESTSINSMSDSIIPIRENDYCDDIATISLHNDELRFTSQMSNEDSSGYSSEPWHQKQLASTRSSLSSIFSDVCSNRKLSIESVSEISTDHERLNRRILRNLSTSFENVLVNSTNSSISSLSINSGNIYNMYNTITGTSSNLNGMSDGWLSKLRRNSEISMRRKTSSGDALTMSTSHSQRKRARLAVAVIITMNDDIKHAMNEFCLEHATLFESMLNRLRFAGEKAYMQRQRNVFMLTMIRAWVSLSRWFTDLFSLPRSLSPVWIHLSNCEISSRAKQNPVVGTFVSDLIFLLNSADTKQTNFFMSTLITAVMSYHCGWVSTVAPLFVVDKDVFGDKRKTSSNRKYAKLSEISKCYPYNALWAQFSELQGSLTTPMRSCKTIICGTSANVRDMSKVLNVLTYFIRSSEIKRNKLDRVFDMSQLNSKLKNEPSRTLFNSNISQNSNLITRSTTTKPLKLSKTSSTVRNLNFLDVISTESNDEYMRSPELLGNDNLLSSVLKKNVMNDIPKVLAFRDSRMVKQELRIGNKSMDTGLERNEKDKAFLRNYIKTLNVDDESKNSSIKLTVTTPDGDEAIELDVNEKLSDEISSDTEDELRFVNSANAYSSQVEFILGEDERLLTTDNNLNPNENPHYHSTVRKENCLFNSRKLNSSRKLFEIEDLENYNYHHHDDDETEPKKSSSKSNFQALSVIELPLLESIELVDQADIKPGFTQSLFPLACDRYIDDMILQGCTSSPVEWEQALRRDLCIKSKRDGIEHFAIIANIERHEVRIASSSLLPSNSTGAGIVGMSNLIAVMLETVQALANSGASDFQCLSLMENKLREIYQLSEALASFLLEIEFCTLNQLASSLHLSMNDVPLLMSIASIHSPIIAKKCGITFR